MLIQEAGGESDLPAEVSTTSTALAGAPSATPLQPTVSISLHLFWLIKSKPLACQCDDVHAGLIKSQPLQAAIDNR